MPSHVSWIVLLVSGLLGQAPRQAPAPVPNPPPSSVLYARLLSSQLTVRRGHEQFRATAIAREGSVLTVQTAAHCLGPRDVGETVILRQADKTWHGTIEAAAQNPDYRPIPSRDPQSKAVRGVLCVDNAVATIRISTEESPGLGAIATAELTESTAVGGRTQTVTVVIFDQRGREHVLSAGNHLNPKCLAWGNASYRPSPGDSGAGVFLMREGPAGQRQPILIGNVALADARGGIAPLLTLSTRWVEEAFENPKMLKPK